MALHHAGLAMLNVDHDTVAPFGGVTFGFHVGVDFFFVLSGFLITWIHWPDIGNVARLKGYVLRRFSRIYPAYWCILIPLAALHFAGARTDIIDFIESILLVPTANGPILGVAWTLTFEIFFYLSFAGLILVGTRAIWLLPAWAAAILVHYAVAKNAPFPASFFFSLYNLEFMTGIAAALILRRYKIPLPGLFLGLGILIFFGASFLRVGTIIGPDSLEFRLIFLLASGLIVLGIVEIDRSYSFEYPPWLVLFGAASYSVYLTHSLVEAGVAKLMRPVIFRIPPDLSLIIISIFGIASGILFHLAIERRLNSKIRSWLFPQRPKFPVIADAAATASAQRDGK